MTQYYITLNEEDWRLYFPATTKAWRKS